MLSNLTIYGTAHGICPVDIHLSRLEETIDEPDIVCVESNDTDEDPKSVMKRFTLKSPATAFAFWYMARKNVQVYNEMDKTAERNDSELEAAKLFADSRDIPCVPVDITYGELVDRYASWPRVLRDIILLVGGVISSFLILLTGGVLLLIGILLVIGGSLNILNLGNIWLGLIGAVFGMIWILGSYRFFRRYTPVPFKGSMGQIMVWFRNEGLRNIREQRMYENITTYAEKYSSKGVLLIVGAAHFKGLSEYAKRNRVSHSLVKSPSVENYDGDIMNMRLEDMTELTC